MPAVRHGVAADLFPCFGDPDPVADGDTRPVGLFHDGERELKVAVLDEREVVDDRPGVLLRAIGHPERVLLDAVVGELQGDMHYQISCAIREKGSFRGAPAGGGGDGG